VSSLLDRIKLGGWNQTTAVYTPNAIDPRLGQVNTSTVPASRPAVASYGAVKQIPLVRIGIYDGVVSYENQQPLNDPKGLLIPEDQPGRWGQLYRAGRIY